MQKLKYIFIPTLGRLERQITYSCLPQHLKDITYFVVQEHESYRMKTMYGDNKVLTLPSHIKAIAETREWIHNLEQNNEIYWVLDDDIKFKLRTQVDNKWKVNLFTEQDFIDLVNQFEEWLNDDITFCAMVGAEVPPSAKYYPFNENAKVMLNVCFNKTKMPKDLKWTEVPYGEDIHITLQLLYRGHKNRVSYKHVATNNVSNAPGGCSSTRTLKRHNDSQRLLNKLWPNFIRLENKKLPKGKQRTWVCDDILDDDGDPFVVNLNVYFKKAFKSFNDKK